MKSLLVLLIASFSISASAGNCFLDSLNMASPEVTTKYDFMGNCTEAITSLLVKHNCSKKEIATELASFAIQYKSSEGGHTYCKMESSHGIYQVMQSDMAEPPTTVIMYSRMD